VITVTPLDCTRHVALLMRSGQRKLRTGNVTEAEGVPGMHGAGQAGWPGRVVKVPVGTARAISNEAQAGMLDLFTVAPRSSASCGDPLLSAKALQLSAITLPRDALVDLRECSSCGPGYLRPRIGGRIHIPMHT
jgi:hypothetical protein